MDTSTRDGLASPKNQHTQAGTHSRGSKNALTRSVNDYARGRALRRRSEPYRRDIREGSPR